MSARPTASILIIGNEILSGRTQDANVQFIAERLSRRGIDLAEIRVVRDEEAAIVRAVRDLSRDFDYVFSTGGIGPTHDDITADCMAKAFGTALDIDPEAKRRLESFYASSGAPLNEGRLRMARIPAGARLIDNPVSGAPGFKIKNVYVMAGVPKIMQAMFLSLEPELARGAPLLSATVQAALREGDIALDLEALQKKYPDVEIGSYPALSAGGKPNLSLVLRTADEARLRAATEEVAAMAERHGGQASVSPADTAGQRKRGPCP